MGTLGGGNHFIEADQDRGRQYLSCHPFGKPPSGAGDSRFYQDLAYKSLKEPSRKTINQMIESYKAQGRQGEIEAAVKALHASGETTVPRGWHT